MVDATPPRVARPRKHRRELLLSRVRDPGGPGEDTILETFVVPLVAFKEDGVFVAIHAPLEGVLTGVGATIRAAIKEFATCFAAMVALHTEAGTRQAFLNRYFPHERGVTTVRVRVADEGRATFESIYPSYRERGGWVSVPCGGG